MRRALCAAGGALLAAGLLLAALLSCALSTPRFERALLATVDRQAMGLSEADLSAFASQTMAYLRGEQAQWQPSIPKEGVADSFRTHMAAVRRAAMAAPWLAGLMIGCGAGLWLAGGRQRRAARGGIAALAGALALAALWAAADFSSFWMVLHRVFIRGGIFPYGEPVMRLFPLALFLQYLPPVCLRALALLAALWAAAGALHQPKDRKR